MMNQDNFISRRCWLDWALSSGLGAWAIWFLAPVLSYLWPAQRRGPDGQTVSAGKVSDWEEWQAKMIAFSGRPIIVIRTPQGLRAFSAVCTHLGCIVQWNAQRRQIACPCHAGFFDTNGRVVGGPPPRPLAEHTVVVVNGEALVKPT